MSSGLRVSGGTGFIGSNPVSWLPRHPASGRVTIVGECCTGSWSLLGSDLADSDFRRESVLNAGLLDQAVARADAVSPAMHPIARVSPRALQCRPTTDFAP
ncbi:hypothetical protein FRZ03_28155 [Streptomyces misionensis]|uniref:NAD-dependent epimerase/dehydratase family protein n=1 Tax=Streptomyces misionensis TaxID=67331 RepID=A0A5C6J133_9ACTN|nr:hypothetical protein FRZ03_28155 [Streptomyces misionensis]